MKGKDIIKNFIFISYQIIIYEKNYPKFVVGSTFVRNFDSIIKNKYICNENIYSVTIENNNYSSTIETIYYNDISSRYMVLENDTEYYMEILSTGDVVIDSRRYSSDSLMI